MSELQLRPHHALCIQFFCGHGYNEEFTLNMKRTINEMGDGTIIEITCGEDILCSHCPNLKNGKCISEGKVSEYDKCVAEICGFYNGLKITAHKFFKTAKEKIILSGKLNTVCKGCQWLNLCKSRKNP